MLCGIQHKQSKDQFADFQYFHRHSLFVLHGVQMDILPREVVSTLRDGQAHANFVQHMGLIS